MWRPLGAASCTPGACGGSAARAHGSGARAHWRRRPRWGHEPPPPCAWARPRRGAPHTSARHSGCWPCGQDRVRWKCPWIQIRAPSRPRHASAPPSCVTCRRWPPRARRGPDARAGGRACGGAAVRWRGEIPAWCSCHAHHVVRPRRLNARVSGGLSCVRPWLAAGVCRWAAFVRGVSECVESVVAWEWQPRTPRAELNVASGLLLLDHSCGCQRSCSTHPIFPTCQRGRGTSCCAELNV